MNISRKRAGAGRTQGIAALMALCLAAGCSMQQPASPDQSSGVQITADAPEQNSAETLPDVPESTEPEVTEPEVSEPEITEPETSEPEATGSVPETVTILGQKYTLDTEYLDLSEMSPMNTYMVATALTGLENLKEINMMREDGTSKMPLSGVAVLKSAVPYVHFIYSFDLFGSTVTTDDTRVSFVKTAIGNEGEETIRQALTVLDRCTYFLLDDCGIDDEVMDGIRSDYPDTKVVWRIHVGTRSALTDDQVIRMTHGINDTMTGPLKYCNEVVYMDLGHDSGITDISFIANMPLLECIILSDSKFKDLTPLTHCPNLTWVELVYCDRIEDISVIAGMESIKYLNISYTYTRDISSLWDMDLDRFSCIANGISQEVIDEYREAHPDCLAVFSGNPYGYAWRYDDYGYHFFSYYARMREVFRYTQGSPGGFKLPEYEAEEENHEEV